MKILFTGASGLVGTALSESLKREGHGIVKLSRVAQDTGESWTWNPGQNWIQWGDGEEVDAVVHLAGKNIAAQRWSPAVKRQIRDSRVEGTRLLAKKLASLSRKPRVLISASAVGIYGDQGDRCLDEGDTPGEGFLAQVANDWEFATRSANDAGIRVARLRFGMILSPRGGALPSMLLPFRLGLGGRVGSGRQYWSWIDLEDAVRVVHEILINDSLSGPVNVVSPHPVTNREFTRILAATLRRPAFLPVPAFGVRLALGEMADALLLASTRVKPTVLENAGFSFHYPDLKKSLDHSLAKRGQT